MYTPIDILTYVIEKEKEADFMMAISLHKMGYSIGEIADAKFVDDGEKIFLRSQSYAIDQQISDMDIMIASKGGKYISSFISRYDEKYNIHFLVHDCLEAEKAEHEDEIAMRVVQYMILKTIKQLRLDTPEKVESYIKV